MKNQADTRKPYSGLSRSFVIAIDVGTTFSGVRFTTTTFIMLIVFSGISGILCCSTSRTRRNSKKFMELLGTANMHKKYKHTNVFYRFPGQEHIVGNSKIPSIIYFDKHGNLMAAGAEAESTVVAQAED
jgi:hypothetical protein